MGEYRVYKVGEDEHVREATDAAQPHERRGSPRRPRASGAADPGQSALGRWWPWALIAAAVVTAALLYWFFGREAVGNSRAALDIAKLSGKVPGWAVLAAPVVVVAAVAAVTVYLAFGRHLAVKIVGVAVVVLVLATPGLAVGYANGLVSDVGGDQTGSAAKTPEEQSQIKAADKEIVPALPNKPMNILLIGSDKTTVPGDPGRSDTQMLVRLDPETKSISMLSLPRDLRVNVEGVGETKMNEAYSYGGPRLVIRTFKQLTGLPINGWIEVNFAGFWHVTNILGGVYFPVDHRYFVPASADYKSINLQPGYQLVRGKQALNFVRFRHDQKGDFTRMQRQQLFIRELQHQSDRWSGDWKKVIKLIKAITKETESSFSSLKKLEPLVELAFQVDTSKVYTAHLEGDTPMIDGISYVTATDSQIADVVHQFTNPAQAPVETSGTGLRKQLFTVSVVGRSARALGKVADQLGRLDYHTVTDHSADSSAHRATIVYAPKYLRAQATLLGEMFWPSLVRIVDRSPGVSDAVTVVLGSSFSGRVKVPKARSTTRVAVRRRSVAWSSWRALAKKTPLRLEAPTVWPAGSAYEQFRSYAIKGEDGERHAAAVAVVETPNYGYWCVQAMRWANPPALKEPTYSRTIDGRNYLLFYEGDALHLVAWRHRGTVYWIVNTLDNQLPDDVMLRLAVSCRSVD
jgi:LCP family protein required for cell wall assembly